ncbi:hypothetical protein ABEB36_002206 [Hypothenemus hampei]|uniref:Uncharacterized protein n=1 Tax=Hypothenemus hampei TaxID=57062 RepID=A0ABD1F819_HYPHA
MKNVFTFRKVNGTQKVVKQNRSDFPDEIPVSHVKSARDKAVAIKNFRVSLTMVFGRGHVVLDTERVPIGAGHEVCSRSPVQVFIRPWRVEPTESCATRYWSVCHTWDVIIMQIA